MILRIPIIAFADGREQIHVARPRGLSGISLQADFREALLEAAKESITMKIRITGLIYSVCLFAALAISLQMPARAQSTGDNHRGKLVEFDAPLAGTAPGLGTQPLANSDLGVVVGGYEDANTVFHGFLRIPDGHLTSFDAPKAGSVAGANQGTVAYSINDLGVIAGAVVDSNTLAHGFVRFPGGSYSTFEAPEAGTAANQGTWAYNINLEGATAGIYVDGSNVQHGYVSSTRGRITGFDPTGSIYTMVCEETCLNAEGVATGFWEDAGFAIHGFIREPNGAIATVDAPGADGETISASINSEGTTTGYFIDSSGVAHGYVRTRGGEFTTIDAPGATGIGTAAFSINALGTVTGEFFDANNVMHGFSRSAGGAYSTFDAPAGGTIAFQGTRPSTNNLEAAVTGWYVDGNNVYHGFVWAP